MHRLCKWGKNDKKGFVVYDGVQRQTEIMMGEVGVGCWLVVKKTEKKNPTEINLVALAFGG